MNNLVSTTNNAVMQVVEGITLIQLSLSGQQQIIKLDQPVSTWGELRQSVFKNYFQNSNFSNYTLTMATAEQGILGDIPVRIDSCKLPVDSASMVQDGDIVHKAIGIFAIPLKSKAGAKKKSTDEIVIDRKPLLEKVKATITARPTAKDYFKGSAKSYTNVPTAELAQLYSNYAFNDEVVTYVKSIAKVEIASVVKSVADNKAKNGKAALKEQLANLYDSLIALINAIPEIEEVKSENTNIAEKVVYSLSDFANGMHSYYSKVLSLKN
jgi:hypothetical protein